MDNDERMEHVTEVQAKYADRLMALPYVVGVGVGLMKEDGAYTQEIGLVVMVEQMPPEDLPEDERIPAELEGVKVDVQLTGSIQAQ